MNKKKICFVIPTLTGGGMERVISELANYFSSIDNDVYIICLINHKPFYKVSGNVKVYFPDKIKGNRNIFYWVKIIFYLRRTITSLRPNTVLSIPQGYSILTIFALLGTSIPVFVSDRNSPNKPLNSISKILRKIFYPLAKGIIAQTQFAKDKLIESGVMNNNIIVIPNPLRKLTFYPKAEDYRIVINIGRLVMEKNQSELIKIFSEINAPEWKLHIIGSGPLKQDLLTQIKKLNMTRQIIIVDAVSDVDRELSKSDIFAFTSIYEGFPNALNEAMAYPLASIAYDCIAGPREMINDGVNGYLVPLHSREEYKYKLKQLMTNQTIREKFAVESKLNRDKFSLEIVGQQYLNFILKH